MTNEILVQADHICKYFKLGGGRMLHAVEDVNLTIHRGETLGLVGESGCGKSTLGRTMMGIYTPTKGRLIYGGKEVDLTSKRQRFDFAKKAQIIFQDPYASLDPRMTVGSIIAEGMEIHGMYDAAKRQERVAELLDIVGLNREHANRFPHEFSGGQRQRIGIARALAIEPEFIVCDEPISALDVSIQAQIINMLEELQARFGMTYLFVSHDLSMVRHISKRVAVMYLGHIVEMAPVNELYANMLHPYTKALMSAVPIADPDAAEKSKRIVLQGDVPQPINPPSGCPFRTRCPYADEGCAEQIPKLKDMGGGHMVACHKVQ